MMPSPIILLALFLAFAITNGYSYVILGAGAAFGACALVADRADLTEWALLLMLAGSCGLIAFDRRAARCWMVTDCPMEKPTHADR